MHMYQESYTINRLESIWLEEVVTMYTTDATNYISLWGD